jgi:hypothetical protein
MTRNLLSIHDLDVAELPALTDPSFKNPDEAPPLRGALAFLFMRRSRV